MNDDLINSLYSLYINIQSHYNLSFLSPFLSLYIYIYISFFFFPPNTLSDLPTTNKQTNKSYHLPNSSVDGSAWGTSFCHLFLMTHGATIFPSLLHSSRNIDDNSFVNRNKSGACTTTGNDSFTTTAQGRGIENSIVDDKPRIFGFRIHANAYIRYPMIRR